MRRPIASQVFQQDGRLHAAQAMAFYTGFIGAAEHPHPSTAIRNHFRHEWHAIKFAIFVEHFSDLSPAADLRQFTTKEMMRSFR